MCSAMMSDSKIGLTMMILIDDQAVRLQGANTQIQDVQTAPSM